MFNTDGAKLSLDLNCVKFGQGWVVNEDIQVEQQVLLPRGEPNLQILASTWNRTSLIFGQADRVVQSVSRKIADHVSELLNDYLAVNPKQSAK